MSYSYLMTWAFYPLGYLGSGLAILVYVRSRFKGPRSYDGLMMSAALALILISIIGNLIYTIVLRDWSGVGFNIAILIFIFYRPRKGRMKKVAKLIGAKSRAIRNKVVRKLKDARGKARVPGGLQPSPV